MKRLLLLLAVLLPAALHAQTVMPLYGECSAKKCSGSFSVRNDQVIPLAVTLDARSFTLKDGKMVWQNTLAPGVALRLSGTSVRLGPKQSYRFGFKASCATIPCQFAVLPDFSGMHLNNGIKLDMHLDYAVYVCAKKKECRANALRAGGYQLPADKKGKKR